MDYLETDTSNCSLGRTVELVGQPWVVLILREVVWGVRRFSEMQEHMGVSKSVLERRAWTTWSSTACSSAATTRSPASGAASSTTSREKGKDLYPVLTALRQWGDKYLTGPEGPQSIIIATKAAARACT